ncbi:hypothetical protein BATDEDRAFT_26975 [Batrachochytrium dendrobatidis JAM81]|uniref:Uncharacterized protein n=2 Tax=Batrachochytrium dendrobatidis TaxID=109871 RepID=F4P8R4_BATDJ|nr:uncharacterized protein BATDEDRAFT_26975 [Batrachochytrium dendrobatidis JAM81]EGF78360.1 hypothetical protein BATDEDRAFT_26975 [Batrachochytrium dendrobatidis JAM81]|eukprot:XP_006681107.1 hypothetical protein BATDEDRAFT_26975 [Batrachochytrium dendrobatidis JAM81]
MKFIVVVLSSTLLGCSVTIATPVLPTATTSAKPSTLTAYYQPDMYVKIRSAGHEYKYNLKKITSEDKRLIRNYLTEMTNHDPSIFTECKSAKDAVTAQKRLMVDLNTGYERFKHKHEQDPQNSNHILQLKSFKLEIRIQSSKLAELQNNMQSLEFKRDSSLSKLQHQRERVLLLLFKKFTDALSITLYALIESGYAHTILDRQSYEAILNRSVESGGASSSRTQSSSQQAIQSVSPSHTSAKPSTSAASYQPDIYANVYSVGHEYKFVLSGIPDEEKRLIRNYFSGMDHHSTKILPECKSAKDAVTAQKQLIVELNTRCQQSRHKHEQNPYDFKHIHQLENLELEIQIQSSKLVELQNSMQALEFKRDDSSSKLKHQKERVLLLLFTKFINALAITLHVLTESGYAHTILNRESYEAILNRSVESGGASSSRTQSSSQQAIQSVLPSHTSAVDSSEQYGASSENPDDLPPSYDEVMRNPQKFPGPKRS